MKSRHLMLACSTIIFALGTGTVASRAQEQEREQDQNRERRDQNRRDENRNDRNGRFDEHDRQVTRDWYNQRRNHPPAGLRDRDRFSPDEESRFREGVVIDPDLRRREYRVPRDLYRQLPPPPRHHRYIVIGGHIAVVDNDHQVRDVIHLHDDGDRR